MRTGEKGPVRVMLSFVDRDERLCMQCALRVETVSAAGTLGADGERGRAVRTACGGADESCLG